MTRLDTKQSLSENEVLSRKEIESSIEAIQEDLRAYIISLAGHGNDCDDIIQETQETKAACTLLHFQRMEPITQMKMTVTF